MIHNSKSLLTKFAKRYTRSRQLIPVMSRVLHTAKDDPYAAIKSGCGSMGASESNRSPLRKQNSGVNKRSA